MEAREYARMRRYELKRDVKDVVRERVCKGEMGRWDGMGSDHVPPPKSSKLRQGID